MVLFHAGRFDEAITEARRTLDLDPGFRQDYSVLVRAYTLKKGMYPEAREALSEWQRQSLESGYRTTSLGSELIGEVRKTEGSATCPRSLGRDAVHALQNPSITFAAALVAAGERDRAFDAINQFHRAACPQYSMWLKSTPELVAIRSDPRFAAAISKMASN